MLALFVPHTNSDLRCRIGKGSAIVGDKDVYDGNGRITIYFENNKYAAVNIKNYADRALVAALRLHDQVATVARATIDPCDLVEVGLWDEENSRAIIDPDKRHELDYWLSYQIRDDELKTTEDLSR